MGFSTRHPWRQFSIKKKTAYLSYAILRGFAPDGVIIPI